MSDLLIYLDTSVWNALCDQKVDPSLLYSSLKERDAQIVLGSNAVYEMAKTFQIKGGMGQFRGQELFLYLTGYLRTRVPYLRETGDLLREETKRVNGETRSIAMFYPPENYLKLEDEVNKLSRGIFDQRAESFISARKLGALDSRQEIQRHLENQPALLQRLAGISESEVARWITKEAKRPVGRRILAGHLSREISDGDRSQLTWFAKRLLASNQYKVSQALVRTDLYWNWRFAQVRSIRSDLPDDTYHLVNAAYCGIFVTSDSALASGMSHLLPTSRIIFCDPAEPIDRQIFASLE